MLKRLFKKLFGIKICKTKDQVILPYPITEQGMKEAVNYICKLHNENVELAKRLKDKMLTIEIMRLGSPCR